MSPKDPRGLGVTRKAYFSLSKLTKQFSKVTSCDTSAGIELSFWADGERKMEED